MGQLHPSKNHRVLIREVSSGILIGISTPILNGSGDASSSCVAYILKTVYDIELIIQKCLHCTRLIYVSPLGPSTELLVSTLYDSTLEYG